MNENYIAVSPGKLVTRLLRRSRNIKTKPELSFFSDSTVLAEAQPRLRICGIPIGVTREYLFEIFKASDVQPNIIKTHYGTPIPNIQFLYNRPVSVTHFDSDPRITSEWTNRWESFYSLTNNKNEILKEYDSDFKKNISSHDIKKSNNSDTIDLKLKNNTNEIDITHSGHISSQVTNITNDYQSLHNNSKFDPFLNIDPKLNSKIWMKKINKNEYLIDGNPYGVGWVKSESTRIEKRKRITRRPGISEYGTASIFQRPIGSFIGQVLIGYLNMTEALRAAEIINSSIFNILGKQIKLSCYYHFQGPVIEDPFEIKEQIVTQQELEDELARKEVGTEDPRGAWVNRLDPEGSIKYEFQSPMYYHALQYLRLKAQGLLHRPPYTYNKISKTHNYPSTNRDRDTEYKWEEARKGKSGL